MKIRFSQAQLEALAAALGETDTGISGSQIGHLLAACGMEDPEPTLTKRHRLYNAFARSWNSTRGGEAILRFVAQALRPERFLREPTRYEPLRANANRALGFVGLQVTETGEIVESTQVRTLGEAEQRAQSLRADLSARGVHPDVLAFCRAELLADNYFHAVLEATKSIAEKIRSRTGLHDDGATLVDRALGGELPLLAINPYTTESEKSEQRGFANLVKGVFGMFRNTTAHAARIHWKMEKSDAEDLLSLASLIHRRLDNAHMPPRV
jgi:uncharacterized protein (TIGR02391 family)